MSSRLSHARALLPILKSALQSFQSSQAGFRIVHTTNTPTSNPNSAAPPRTLFILDSSFNPPSIAHRSLIISALRAPESSSLPRPYSLLLLFSTHNADKAPTPAAFEQRLAMMALFAEDISSALNSTSESEEVPIDIGLTTSPYYTDKSAAITQSQHYPSHPTHVHLLGFDTLTRFFAAKYYPDHHPPFSALEPFFSAGHRLRVTIRPDEDYGDEESQREFWRRLERGDMEGDGGKKEWAKQVEMVNAGEGVGVSSTKVRKASVKGDWETVNKLCTGSVAEWVKTEGVYNDLEDAEKTKMMN